MGHQVLWSGVFLLALGVLIGASELLYRVLGWPAERSRKFLHVSGGLLCLSFPSLFSSTIPVLVLTATAFIILLVSYMQRLLPSIHRIKRHSAGSILFPVPVLVCFALAQVKHNDLYYYLPVALLTLADTAAETGGQLWGKYSRQFFNGQKTLAGSLCFFITALPVAGCCFYFFTAWPLLHCLLIALLFAVVAAVTELITLHGWDNLSVPAVVVVLVHLL